MRYERIALIGFGEVGQALAAALKPAGIAQWAYDVTFTDADSAPHRAAQDMGITLAETAAEAAEAGQLILSAVTAAQTVEAARYVCAGTLTGRAFVDLNSASPGAKSQQPTSRATKIQSLRPSGFWNDLDRCGPLS